MDDCKEIKKRVKMNNTEIFKMEGETEKIIEGILAQEEENSEIPIDKVREYLRKAISDGEGGK